MADTTTNTTGLTAAPATTTTTSAAMPGVTVTAPAVKTVDHAKEQADLKKIQAETAGKTEYEKQEAYGKMAEDKMGEDSFRKANRLERERMQAEGEGDPTRDPVAKQAAMDKTVVQPGAVADAQKIKQIGKDKAAEQAAKTGTDGKVNPNLVSK